MLVLAVRPDLLDKRLWAALVHAAKQHLKEKGQRILIVGTSGTDTQILCKNGYEDEARVRDFWAA